MEVGDHRRMRAANSTTVPSLSEDVRTLLAATVIDVCAAASVPYCAVSRVVASRRSTSAARITVSIGTAAFPDDATLMEELVDKADWAMYLAKREGRDRVVSFEGAGEIEGAEDRAAKRRRSD